MNITDERRQYLQQHIKYWMKPGVEPSEVGYRVANLLDLLVNGLHHVDTDAAKKARWDDRLFVQLNWRYDEFATHDANLLTRLVFLAHDLCIRVSIQSATIGMLRLMFHPRKDREGGNFATRHPTLESAVAQWRDHHPSNQ